MSLQSAAGALHAVLEREVLVISCSGKAQGKGEDIAGPLSRGIKVGTIRLIFADQTMVEAGRTKDIYQTQPSPF